MINDILSEFVAPTGLKALELEERDVNDDSGEEETTAGRLQKRFVYCLNYNS